MVDLGFGSAFLLRFRVSKLDIGYSEFVVIVGDLGFRLTNMAFKVRFFSLLQETNKP